MPVRLSSNFDAGAIDVVADGDPANLDVRLRADSHADIRQWFYFRLQGARDAPVRIRFTNAGASTYPDGWRGLPGRRVLRPPRLVPRADDLRRHDADDRAHACARQRVLRILRAVFLGASPRTARARRRVAARPRERPGRDGRRPRPQSRDGRHAGAGTQGAVGDRAAAPRRDDGRVVRRGPARARARSRRPGRAQAARGGGAVRGAEHEPGRQRARQPAHQRRRRQPQPRMDGAVARAQSRGLSRPRGDAAHRRRRVPRRPRRRRAALRLHGRQRAAADLFAAHGGAGGRLHDGAGRREPGLPDASTATRRTRKPRST